MPFVPSSIDQTNAALFRLTFDKIPNTTFYSFSVNVPGITLGEALHPTPFLDIRKPGDKITFDPLILNFIVQENLANYVEIFNWMVSISNLPIGDNMYHKAKTKEDIYSNATLFILSNKQNPIMRVRFIECYPTALSPLNYDAAITDVAPVSTDATFNYSYYIIEPV